MADQLPPRRRFQFRLRTMMIAVTLLAVPCAYIGWQATKMRDRKAWIESNSATYSIKQEYVLAEGTRVMTQERIGPNSRLSHGLEYYVLNQGRGEDSPGWVRRLLGDEPIDVICIKEDASTAEMRSVVVLFPEAKVFATRRTAPAPATKP
jgi:hypothetical protein